MQVVEVVRDRPVERRRRRVNDEVVMAGIRAVEASRRHAHVAQPEMDRRLGRKRCALFDVDEIHGGAGSRRRWSALGLCLGEVGHDCREQHLPKQYRCAADPELHAPLLSPCANLCAGPGARRRARPRSSGNFGGDLTSESRPTQALKKRMANSEWRIEGGYGLLPNSLFAIRCSLVFEFVVGAGAGALRGDTALEELWRVLALARLARLAWLA